MSALTVFVQGTGGAVYEMDVPTFGMALERWNEKVAKGELSIIPEAHWVEVDDKTKKLVAGPAPKPEKAKPTPAPEGA